MKLLYIHQHFTTPSGAGGTRSYEFARRMVERGHHVTMVCGSHSLANTGLTGDFVQGRRTGLVDGINIIEIAITYSNNLSFFERVKQFFHFAYDATRIALSHEYDLIYATTTPLTVAIPALVAKKIKRKRYLFEVRDLWPELPKAMGAIKNKYVLKAMDLLESMAYRNAAHCVALSPGIAEGIQKKLALQKTTLIPNGSDTDFFLQGKYQSLPGFSEDDFICLFAGAHGEANGLDAVLNVAKLLKESNKRIKFLFVGEGKIKKHLINRKNTEELDNCIFWNPVSKKEMRNVFKSVHLGLMVLRNVPAFYYGTSPNKFFDYLAAGLPVLNNYPGWLSELITKNHCGVAVSPDQPNQFMEVLEFLERNREKLKEMGNNAFKLAVKEFDRDQLANQFIDTVEHVYSC